MKQLKLKVSPRNEKGRGPVRRLRKAGHVPGVIYGKKSDPQAISVEEPVLRKLMRATHGTTALIQVEGLEGGSKLSVIQSLDRHAYRDTLEHVDLQEVSQNDPIQVAVAVHVHGDAKGIKEGGIFEFPHHQVQVKCLPKNLPEGVEIDVSELAIGDKIHVGDLKPIEGVTFTEDPDVVIAACSAPRVSEASDSEEPAEGEAAEGEGEASAEGEAQSAESADAESK